MPETRKYTKIEIDWVLARIAAGWKSDIIAKAFKKEYPFWKGQGKNFTRKQVSYIKGAHKRAPG